VSGDKAHEKVGTGRTTRLRDFLLGAVLRPLVLAFWAFVLWGTLLAALFVVRMLSAGWAAAVASFWLEPEASAWAFLNVGSVGLALVVWTAAGLLLMLRRPHSDSLSS
jgi:hypothetical protein